MTKRTWRFRSMQGQAADVMAASTSLRAAAKTLGVNLSTIVRWRQAGKIPPPGRRRAHRSVTALAADLPAGPEGWGGGDRASYTLDATETELVTLAEAALLLARIRC